MKKYILIIAVAILALSSCGNGDKFRLSGTIDNAANTTLYLQSSINGRWIVIDTVSVNDNGGFDYQRQAPRFPEIYRLVLDDIDNAIYFPIDSLEHLTINSSKENFGTAYTLEGSEQAVNMMNIDKKAQAITRKGIAAAGAEYVEFKKELVGQILANPSSILAYYIINKHIGDVPVFSPADKNDVRIIGAVANAYNAFKPNDPRTKLLVATFLSNRQIEIPNTAGLDTIVATEAKILDIELPDMTGIDFLGNMQQQSSHWCKVVIYTAYNEYMLPAFRNKAFDFLTKPINDDELQTIIERFYVECNNRANPQAQNDAINSKDGKLLFYTNTMDFRLIDIRDICAFAYEHELRVWTVVAAGCEKPLRLKRNVNKETLLALNDSFVQVSQKHIININYLLEVRDNVCHFYPPFEKIDSIKVGRFFRRKLVNRYNSL